MAGIRAPRGPRPDDPARDDAGFTIIEVLVAIGLLGIVMTALTSFFASTLSVANAQSGRQAAAKVAADAAERVHALKGSAVTAERDQASSDVQWAAGLLDINGVKPYLADMAEAYDASLTLPPSSGATAPLPTTAQSVVVDAVSYRQNWYVGRCWQPVAGGACGSTLITGYVPFFRVVVAVTWPERHCPAGACSYVVVTLVSSTSGDPIFGSNATAVAPAVTNPGNQTGETTGPLTLQLAATGGAPPLTWSATGLPAGLTISSAGLISGTPSAVGTSAVTVRATDSFALVGTAAFSWTITPGPALTAPAAQSSQGGSPIVALTTVRTGGVGPFAWTAKPGPWGATGLPPGLAINASTGAITGTPTQAGAAAAVTLTVTDSYAATASTTFTWAVPPLTVPNPGPQTIARNDPGTSVQISAAGGIRPYVYAANLASGLPAGLSINAGTGLITGSATATGIKAVTVTVTDAAATAVTMTFTITVINAPVIAALPDRTDPATANVTFSASASGGSGGYTWSAVNLPPGIVMSTGGAVSGKPTATTRYIPTITVVDGIGGSDSQTFDWNVTTSTGGLKVTAPAADRSGDTANVTITPFTAVATGGFGFYGWSATGLPAGVTINSSSGVVSGKPTAAGVYTAKLTVKDAFGFGSTSVYMFVWTVA
jgi:prepilin-type N-terminal cleavage/methylation domain-containing protein